MSILVIAQLYQNQLSTSTFNVITAAKQIGGDITILVAGQNTEQAAQEAAQIAGINCVFQANDVSLKNNLAENITKLVLSLDTSSFTHILTAATADGKNFLPRIAASLDTEQISEITKIIDTQTFIRPIYAGNALATVQSSAKTIIISVRPTAFAAEEKKDGNAEIIEITGDFDAGISSFISEEIITSSRPKLDTAKIVVAGGRGLKSSEDFKNIIEPLADKLGAAVGASKAAIDAGFTSNDVQIGQTGKVIAPDLYIAIGISGAIQHMAGIKDAKTIVAINQDSEAPICEMADIILNDDLFNAVPELTNKL